MKSKKKGSCRNKLVLLLLVSAACAAVVLLVRDDSCFVVFVQVARMTSPPPPPTTRAAKETRRPYAADSMWEMEWESISRLISSSKSSLRITSKLKVGVLNFNSSEVARWRRSTFDVQEVRLAPASAAVTWDALYPVWIDEGANSSSRCPSLPDPVVVRREHDLVAVKLPCQEAGGGSWSRDVRRLHLQLSAAKLALRSRSSMVLILSPAECFPLPNLFPCKHLLGRHGHAWLYRPDADYLRRRLSLPVGSCQLALGYQKPSSSSRRREAYATVLHSGDAYVCGAIALAQSIRRSGSTRDLVALVDEQGVGAEQRAGLAAAGWQVRPAPRIRNPRATRHAYNEWNYSKFRLWQLTDYHKVVFLDADLLVLRNLDFLFHHHYELSATGNSGARFNSGVMVLEPCNCTFELLMSGIHRIHSYNGGDQGYLNEVFAWWHRLPRTTNLLKHGRNLLVGADTLAVHYLGIKPWLCYRDYDCNWDVPELRRFASDDAHARWWDLHDSIQPAELTRTFCALPAAQQAALERNRRDWNRTITDPRRQATPHA
ncbi:hypothetical protein EJB05_40303, partial [Eragrostis curvula]